MKRRFTVGLAALLAAALIIGGLLMKAPARQLPATAAAEVPAAGVLLTPSRSDATGVDPASSFRLASAEPIGLDQLGQALSVQPAVELRYEQADREGKIYLVKPASPLDANRIYTFRLAAGEQMGRPYQWSFQTRAEFRILGSLPRHQATGVPVDTGIELIFSHENYGDPAPFVSITPRVEGRFERHKKTLAFVPRERLAPGTVYTVIVKPGLAQAGAEGKLTEEYRFAFETAPAGEPEKGAGGHLFVAREVQEFPTGAAPYFQVQYYKPDGAVQAPVAVTVYKYPSAGQFIDALEKADQVPWWASYSAGKFREEPGRLIRVARFETALKQLPGYHTPYLLFPEPLAAGYYLAELTVEAQVRQVRFQVTDLAAYLTVTSTQSLIWVNDVGSQAPVSGAEITHAGGKARTGADGLAAFAMPASYWEEESRGLYLQVRAPGQEAVVALRSGGYGFYDPTPMLRGGRGFPIPGRPPGFLGHWKYLYLDRPLYKPDDTVRIFGVLLPREAGAAPVQAVTAAVVRREYYRGAGTEPPPLAAARLPVADGAFTGALTLPNLKPGSYELQITSGEDYVISRWFEVQAYTKPAYQLSVTSDRQALFAGETVNFRLAAAFFEGTPVPNLALEYSFGWGNGQQGRLVTGADGTATVPFQPGALDSGPNHGGPGHAWFNARASLPEAGEINAGHGVQVFTRNVTLRPAVAVEDGVAVIQARVHHVSLARLNAGEGWEYEGAPAPGLPVEGTLIEENWVREEEGEYYDFIQKRVVKQYRYRHAPREIGQFSAATDAEGKIAHRVSIDPEKSYQVRLRVRDTNGRLVAQDWGFSGRQYQFRGRGGYGPYKYYRLVPAQPEKQVWATGEEVALHLLENDEPVADRPGGFLFYQARLGLREYGVQGTATYRFGFKEPDVPNTNVKGVYFDGREYHEAWEYAVRFDAKQRELQVSVTPDKAEYRPGETVSATVRVTDREGRPVQAHVNLNLVDEALFALRGQEADILRDLYGQHVPAGILRTRQTHEGSLERTMATGSPAPSQAAAPASSPAGDLAPGAAGRGAAPVRRDFQDAPYFTTVATDAAGQARASFKLPDNLTTWRMTYQALAPGNAGAAAGTAPVVVKIPFFVEMVFGDTYLAGDQPVLAVRSFGADLAAGQPVDYEITVTGPDGGKTTTRTAGQAFAPVAVPLGQVAAGTYTVQVRGAAPGGLADALEKQFTAVDSYLRRQKVDFFLLGDQTRVTGPASGLATLTFTDHRRGRYLLLLQQLCWLGGNRLEQKLARALATDLVAAHFDLKEPYPEPEWSPLAYQAPDGSIAILPYSDGDLYLSAVVADAAGDRFDRAALADYFWKALDDPGAGRERAVTALYGLAALREPVLHQVQALLRERDLSLAEQLRLGLALAALGDLEGARPVYRAIWEQHGEKLGSSARIRTGRDQDEIVTATAQAAALAARLGEPEAVALVGYLLENPAGETLVLLEPLLAARAALAELPAAAAAFTYVQDGVEQRVELKPGASVRWHLPAAALAGLRFRAVQGQVGLTVASEGPLSAAELRQEPGFAVSRSYSVEGKSNATAWQQGDLVKVTLTYRIPATAPGGGFELTDYLPSGLRLVQRPWQHGMSWKPGPGPAWPLAAHGQQVSFWAYEQGEPIHYYARVVSPGRYTAEQPVLQHQRSGLIFGHGERAQVQID